MREKILDLSQLREESRRLRAQGKSLVATNGCFDILHVGHVRYLAAARRLGDALAVGLNGDASVRMLKGESRPLNTERDRAEVLAALESVTYVTIFHEELATRFLEAAQPAIYVKGGDYNIDSLDREERRMVADFGAKVEIIPFQAGYSTTALLDKMRNG
ncbi:MAG: adenylyltransferase/cytidyltransferase family protein [Verrucomicrobia bacterium]|nr:adenylyltransferase/cytidyltransferase family protein [Verrucomicrobiota bacterium]